MDYNEMTDIELDRLSAERFYGYVYYDPFYGYVDPKDKLKGVIWKADWWKPTDSETNQVEGWIFPKLRELFKQSLKANEQISFNLHTYLDGDEYYEAWFDKEEKTDDAVVSGPIVQVSGDKLNRIKLIACLQVSDKINGN